MRARWIVPLLLVALLAGGRAEARTRGSVAYSLIFTALGVLQASCFGSATYLRLAAPNADTLMTFKREATIESDLFVVCGIMTVPIIAFGVAGAFTLLHDTERRADLAQPRTASLAPVLPSLMVTGNGAGIGFGGRF